MLLIYKKSLSQAAFSKNPVISFSVLRAKNKDDFLQKIVFSFCSFYVYLFGYLLFMKCVVSEKAINKRIVRILFLL